MAETNVYRVKFEYRYNREREWCDDAKNVLANGSAEAAIAKVRKDALGDEWTDADTGKHYKCTGFRLVAVERVCEIDVT